MKIIRLEDAHEWPEWKELSPEQLKEAYALARAAFTADDLQKFTEIDDIDDVDMGEFLVELEKLQEEHDRKPAP
jgi:hypothetical protein